MQKNWRHSSPAWFEESCSATMLWITSATETNIWATATTNSWTAVESIPTGFWMTNWSRSFKQKQSWSCDKEKLLHTSKVDQSIVVSCSAAKGPFIWVILQYVATNQSSLSKTKIFIESLLENTVYLVQITPNSNKFSGYVGSNLSRKPSDSSYHWMSTVIDWI